MKRNNELASGYQQRKEAILRKLGDTNFKPDKVEISKCLDFLVLDLQAGLYRYIDTFFSFLDLDFGIKKGVGPNLREDHPLKAFATHDLECLKGNFEIILRNFVNERKPYTQNTHDVIYGRVSMNDVIIEIIRSTVKSSEYFYQTMREIGAFLEECNKISTLFFNHPVLSKNSYMKETLDRYADDFLTCLNSYEAVKKMIPNK